VGYSVIKMKAVASILVFVGLAGAVSASGCDSGPVCPAGYNAWESSCYKLYDEVLTWEAAEDRCLDDGAHLASIHSADENDYLNNLAGSAGTTGTWMGYNDLASEDNFVWSDGSCTGYIDWNSGEPNNQSPGEHCGEINFFGTTDDGTWNDYLCCRNNRFICKVTP
uniref:C-type lectin domain-containing protein n=1 Tax=Salmonella sp. s51090 TaxID=3159651 RepID=UPI00397F7344